MRIDGPARPGGLQPRRTKRGGGDRFTLSDQEGASKTTEARPAMSTPALSLTALQTLQTMEATAAASSMASKEADGFVSPAEAQHYAHGVLDALSDLQADLAGGQDLTTVLTRIKQHIEGAHDSGTRTDDPVLNHLLKQIELRLAVELARHE